MHFFYFLQQKEFKDDNFWCNLYVEEIKWPTKMEAMILKHDQEKVLLYKNPPLHVSF